MRLLGLFAVLVLLPGCATVPGPGEIDPLFEPARFAPRTVASSPDDVFGIDEPMRKFLDGGVTTWVRFHNPSRGLVDALSNDLQLGYDTAMTRTARETYAARAGNCLSLVILTGALARELHVKVVYQSVYGEEAWSRSGGIAFHSGHVNLLLGGGVLDRRSDKDFIVDFLPPEMRRGTSRTISQDTVLAMYLNNRAAETMADGDLDAAYAWAQAAVKRDPAFTAAYNTLGVVYLRHGDLVPAERALRYALAREPDDAQVLSNLVAVVTAAGRTEEAAELRARLASIEPYPPFYFMDQGMVALNRGDDQTALLMFKKELRRMPYDDEVHFAMAVANLRLGDMSDARRHMVAALENSTTQDRHDIYAAKLARMKALETHH